MNNLPKNTVLQLGSLITLYVSVTALLSLIFSTTNIALPDAAAGAYEAASNQSQLRFSLALLVVFFPAYLALTRFVNQNRRSTETVYAAVTKWLIYLSLLVSGIVLLIDLVVVLMTFLEGELTLRFAIKAASVVAVIGGVFFYYVRDAQGYWQMRAGMSITYGAVASAIIVGVIGASLYHLESPQTAREMRIDTEVLGTLQDMQWRIEEFYRVNEALPADINELYGEFSVPKAPEARGAYELIVTGEKTYQLCGEFAQNSNLEMSSMDRPMVVGTKAINYTWDYKAGRWCFDREIDDTYRQ